MRLEPPDVAAHALLPFPSFPRLSGKNALRRPSHLSHLPFPSNQSWQCARSVSCSLLQVCNFISPRLVRPQALRLQPSRGPSIRSGKCEIENHLKSKARRLSTSATAGMYDDRRACDGVWYETIRAALSRERTCCCHVGLWVISRDMLLQLLL